MVTPCGRRGHPQPRSGKDMAKQQSGALLTLVMVDRRSSVPPVAGEGMDFEQAAAGIPRLRLAFTMPLRHHPLGRMLSLARRLRQMEWAQDMGIHGYPPSEYCAQPYPRSFWGSPACSLIRCGPVWRRWRR